MRGQYSVKYDHDTNWKSIVQVSNHPQGSPRAAALTGSPDAVDLLCAVVGAERIEVGGFAAGSVARPRWTHASPAFVRAPVDPLDLVPALRRVVKFNRWVVGFAVAGLCLASFGLGQVLASSRLSSLVGAQVMQGGWSFEAVQSDGVRLRTGSTQVDVRVGEALPNGDMVVSVSPNNRMVVLGSGTLVLHAKEAKAARAP